MAIAVGDVPLFANSDERRRASGQKSGPLNWLALDEMIFNFEPCSTRPWLGAAATNLVIVLQ
jgi:hypothetical protein